MPEPGAEIARGALTPMRITPGAEGVPVAYSLPFETAEGSLNEVLGELLEISDLERIDCRACGAVTRKSYGGGYCYDCFKSLARCDLCIVSPDRCHYAQGTCREPEWAQSFCMQPHIVYLANTAGLKVGITRSTNVPGRWLDQGATQALPILAAATREQAGWAERALARFVSDRADWRALVTREPVEIDLVREALRLRQRSEPAMAEVFARFADGLSWLEGAQVSAFSYPRCAHGAATRLRLAPDSPVGGRLVGIRGQYLLFDRGVFNVARHTSYHVRLGHGTTAVDDTDQLSLFD